MEARRNISQAQFAAGRHYQELGEIAFASALRSLDTSIRYTVGDLLTGRQEDAIRRSG